MQAQTNVCAVSEEIAKKEGELVAKEAGQATLQKLIMIQAHALNVRCMYPNGETWLKILEKMCDYEATAVITGPDLKAINWFEKVERIINKSEEFDDEYVRQTHSIACTSLRRRRAQESVEVQLETEVPDQI